MEKKFFVLVLEERLGALYVSSNVNGKPGDDRYFSQVASAAMRATLRDCPAPVVTLCHCGGIWATWDKADLHMEMCFPADASVTTYAYGSDKDGDIFMAQFNTATLYQEGLPIPVRDWLWKYLPDGVAPDLACA